MADIPPKESGPPRKYVGRFVGRISVRASGYFNLRTMEGESVSVHYRFCTLKQYSDGYSYQHNRTKPAS